jgi:hypothetical protein
LDTWLSLIYNELRSCFVPSSNTEDRPLGVRRLIEFGLSVIAKRRGTKRFARGEIGREEYEERRKVLTA